MAEQRMKDAWKTYPRSLPASTYDPVEFDIKEHAKCLAAYRDATGQTDQQLHQPNFSEEECDDCFVQYLQAKNSRCEIDLRDVKAVESMLETTTAKSSSTFITIVQPFSHGHSICWEAFLKILSFLAVFPGFLEILYTFHMNAWGPRDSGLYSQHCNLPPQDTDDQKVQSEASYALCFSLREFEKDKEKWVEGQVGAWMNYHPADDRSVWVYLNASDGFWTRLEDLTESDSANGIRRSDLDIIRLLLSSVQENWSDWLNHLEKRYQKSVEDAVLFDHAQKLESELGEIEKPYNFLRMNRHAIGLMKLGFEKFRRLSAENTAKLAQDAELVEFAASLEKYLMQTSAHQERISAVMNGYNSVITQPIAA